MSDIISKLSEQDDYPLHYGLYLKIMNHRQSNNVLRYHTMPPVRPETVGHHSAGVAILCVAITEQRPSVALLMAALLHDMHESKTGDIPAQAKWASSALSGALEELERKFDDYFMPYPRNLSEYEQRVLKQADMLDLCFKAKEEMSMGNTTYSIILNRGLEFLRNNSPFPVTQAFMKELQHVG